MTSLQSAGLTLEQARAAIERLVEVQASTLGVAPPVPRVGCRVRDCGDIGVVRPRPKQISMGGGH